MANHYNNKDIGISLVTLSQESYDDYRKATVIYFYLTEHWLVKLAVKLKLIKL